MAAAFGGEGFGEGAAAPPGYLSGAGLAHRGIGSLDLAVRR